MTWRDEAFLSKLKCRVLVVGAGGIGCELLKNLVLAGFLNIDVVDLDTIDVSNLNRQFLFRREHVGKSKAETAANAVRCLVPHVNIISHHDSILSDIYDVDFFQQFKVVLGALDNRAARNHVNRLCLAARVPLIESGSSGYEGQVGVIMRDKTECYECEPKPAQKTFPGCTIRNTPTETIHCIVWAKHLFNQLFGEIDFDDEVSPDVKDNKELENGKSTEKNGREESANGSIQNGETKGDAKEAMRVWAMRHHYDPQTIFHKLFHDDMEMLLVMEHLWKNRTKPTPLLWDNLSNQNAGSSKAKTNDDIWTALECRTQLEKAILQLRSRAEDGSILVWDKDDDASMRFVAACGNIRAHIFDIPMKTLFDIKSMAGNIIPAIATTNAIIAGMVVVEAMKVVFDTNSKLRNVFVSHQPNYRQKILVDVVPFKPNPQCYVCSERREVRVKTNVDLTSVRAFEFKFLKGVLNMVAPDAILPFSGKMIVSSEEGETDAIADRKLGEVGVINGCLLTIDDFLQKLEIRVQIAHCATLEEDQFEIATDSGTVDHTNGTTSNDGTMLKRKPSGDLDITEQSPKRTRVAGME